MSTVFGGGQSGASVQSVENTRELLESRQQFIEEQSGIGRQDVRGLFPQADFARNAGLQGALDLISQGINPQLSAFQQGNVGAQGFLGTGLDQFQNAILGTPVNLSGFAPQQIGVDTSFLQNPQLPSFAPQTPPPSVGTVNLPRGNLPGSNLPGGILGRLRDQGSFGSGSGFRNSFVNRGQF